ncbi:MAG: hypothetical protein FWB86_02015 [Treponema sp.]|nr:hypothetical protein [Treponema sp.]MCL2250936.1 hypothetical protein [Treponema sp.]
MSFHFFELNKIPNDISADNITAESELRERERLWEKARHDEAQALSNAREEARKEEQEKLQGVITEKDAEIARLKALLEAQTK